MAHSNVYTVVIVLEISLIDLKKKVVCQVKAKAKLGKKHISILKKIFNLSVGGRFWQRKN